MKMERQNRHQTVTQNQTEEKNNRKERVKAGFNLLNHFVKIYNEGETYVKRGLTLFGFGSIIAGIAFGAGQQISQKEVNAVNDSTSAVQSTPQPAINHTAPTPPPAVIYLAPTPAPIAQPSTITNTSQAQPVPNSTPPSQPLTTTTIPETETVVTKPPIPNQSESISNVLTDVQQAVEPLQQMSGVLSGLKQTVEPWVVESDDD